MKVQIIKPVKSAMQSGKKSTKKWLVKPDGNQTKREINKLMGWTSADNSLSQLNFSFNSKEEAIEFCKSKNFEYEVFEPKQASFKLKSYTENFTK